MALVLGDNIFYGHGLRRLLARATRAHGATVFGYHVNDPERYGVIEFDADWQAISIEEKPQRAEVELRRHRPVFLRQRRDRIAAGLKPSARGELEITDLNRSTSKGAS